MSTPENSSEEEEDSEEEGSEEGSEEDSEEGSEEDSDDSDTNMSIPYHSKKKSNKKKGSSKTDSFGLGDLKISDSPSSGNLGSHHKVISVFKNDASQRIMRVEVCIPALSKKQIKVEVSKDGKTLLFATYCPVGFYKANRLTADEIPAALRFANEHYVPQALKEAGRGVIEDALITGRMHQNKKSILGDPVKIRLPFKVEQHIIKMEINVMGHDDRRLREGHQGFFILMVELEDVVKPKKLAPQRVQTRFFASPIGGRYQLDSDDEEHIMYDSNGNIIIDDANEDM